MRHYRDELVARLPDMSVEDAEQLDAEMSDTLAAALARIKD